MSHFTHIKTRFQNLSYLEKALNRLDIVYKQKDQITSNLETLDKNDNQP
jgi:hypothetical protein